MQAHMEWAKGDPAVLQCWMHRPVYRRSSAALQAEDGFSQARVLTALTCCVVSPCPGVVGAALLGGALFAGRHRGGAGGTRLSRASTVGVYPAMRKVLCKRRCACVCLASRCAKINHNRYGTCLRGMLFAALRALRARRSAAASRF